MTAQFESSLYKGWVFHQRLQPKLHKFSYRIYLWWIKLEELDALAKELKHFDTNIKKRSWLRFSLSDYMNTDKNQHNASTPEELEAHVISRMSALANDSLRGRVFFLGQTRTFGKYFSPVNFWFLQNEKQEFTHMLAEVSNTPWNERHHYLVDLNKQCDTQKAFHVSPFNPMDMTYKWHVQTPGKNMRLHLSCHQQSKQFEAAIDMTRETLSNDNLRKTLFSIPSMTIKTIFGIYWQALKLFVKRVPIYTHT
ncbi:DUF1365 domain-containing protein [Agaribacter flavus]|uniref:DUF1365 domain-containing protein n=1 Tax=Agaribacter flavus TaxID=1902781 RepID=A0ABV7FUB9_9ALTE